MTAARGVAIGGVLGAFTVALLYVQSITPTARLTILAIISLCTAIMIVEAKVKMAIVFYGAVSILGFLIVPDKLSVMPYIFFFGVYPVAKFFIEKINKRVIEYIIKLIIFNVILALGITLALELLFSGELADMPIYILVVALNVAFIIYDFALSIMIDYYMIKIRNRIIK